MKPTDKNLITYQSSKALERASMLAREFEAERQQEIVDMAEDEAQFWRAIYILIHAVAILLVILLVLATFYKQWSVQC